MNKMTYILRGSLQTLQAARLEAEIVNKKPLKQSRQQWHGTGGDVKGKEVVSFVIHS